MKLNVIFIFIILPLSSWTSAAVAQPNVTLAPEERPAPPQTAPSATAPSATTPPATTPGQAAPDQPQPGIPRPPILQLPRETQIEVPLEQAGVGGSTAIGGYGELTLNAPSNGPNIVDLRRLVLYVGHNFTQRLRFYGELEVEHAVTSAQDKGEFEVEQAFLDYLAYKPLNLRAGVIIIPMGIINVYHEPPTFNGVDRPETDTLIIPSTWREPGIGIFGEWRGIRYQAYVVNGFNANGFTASNGLADGHQEAQLALGIDWGLAARVEHAFPWLLRYGISADAGVSFYFSNADQGQAKFKGSQGDTVPVTMVDGDLRARTRGFELRAEIASVWIGGIHRLNRALLADALANMTSFDGPVARQLLGGYVELGYDVLQPLKLRAGRQLIAFARYERVDTQYEVPSDLGRQPGDRHDTVTAGLRFLPIAEVALKLDYQHVWTDATIPADADFYRINAGLAFMF